MTGTNRGPLMSEFCKLKIGGLIKVDQKQVSPERTSAEKLVTSSEVSDNFKIKRHRADAVIDNRRTAEMLSLDHLLSQVGGGIFRLARIAMVRSLQIHTGSPARVEHPKTDKDTTVALKEIAYGRIVIKE